MHRAAAHDGPRSDPPKTAQNSCPRSLLLGLEFLDPAVAALFKFVSQFTAPGADNAATGEHVHIIGHDVIEEALIVRDDDQSAIRRAHAVDAVSHEAKRVNVQPVAGFYQISQFRSTPSQL